MFILRVSPAAAVVGGPGSFRASEMADPAAAGLAVGPYPSAIRVAARRGEHTGAEARRPELLRTAEADAASKEIPGYYLVFMADSASRLHHRRVRQLPRPAAAQARQAHHMLPLLLLEGSCRAVPRPRRCHGRRDPSACGRALRVRGTAVRGRQLIEALSRVALACSPTYRGRQRRASP